MKKIDVYKTTVFNTPILSFLIKSLCRLFMWIVGWKVEGKIPVQQNCVIIAVPHKTGWDLPITLSMFFLCEWKVYWFGKKEIFRFPFGFFFRWLGGIEINRNQQNYTVAQVANLYKTHQNLMLAIPPEGTRKEVREWKTGFYYIALEAGVPIFLGNLDYKHKIARIIDQFTPTGECKKDLVEIKKKYTGFL